MRMPVLVHTAGARRVFTTFAVGAVSREAVTSQAAVPLAANPLKVVAAVDDVDAHPAEPANDDPTFFHRLD